MEAPVKMQGLLILEEIIENNCHPEAVRPKDLNFRSFRCSFLSHLQDKFALITYVKLALNISDVLI